MALLPFTNFMSSMIPFTIFANESIDNAKMAVEGITQGVARAWTGGSPQK